MHAVHAAHGESVHSACAVTWKVAFRVCLTLERLAGSGAAVSHSGSSSG